MAIRQPDSVQVDLNLKLVKVSGTWKPNAAERAAAWEMYVELITRATLVPLEYGLLREFLASTHSIFDRTRQILRNHGSTVAEEKPPGQYSFGYLAIAYLNFTLRPLLAKWHPQLEDWEQCRPVAISRVEHERLWPHASHLRSEIHQVSVESRLFLALLADACNVPDLSAAIPDL